MKSLHLATTEDAPKLLPLVAALHVDLGFKTDAAHQERSILPLLEGSPHGASWLIGPRRAPVGYIVVSFGWSIEYGGMDAIIDELYIRPAVRGRGMAGEAINALAQALKQSTIKALHLEVDRSNEAATSLYQRCGFKARDSYMYMSRKL
ncbi:GNAT family N-acetyltransferase [Puniceibacterium sediminis]|uniref:Acetyltransferase (GNAT) family protein n=1 Tax=Puniceibacterium sediminis TaxID=1608407 RepID=A0A238W4R3_9RHOB|nr:GNAT family N-acetyltransferase [Puniceibacterium sediminis]SNR41153.1 Acetyltransferase (GNAT) family protein [Puniceibacterium sediminis]